ncbi:MAG: helix-turn-helix domain-containing protein [Treponema sp.]|jgi:phage repressor protein C with HTH and peptisase S24 domain|nr:helix-turn-helix domain-containing protein [Treponema sp.]
MKNEAERYKFVLEKSGLSKSAFAESIGISRSHNYHLERGTQKPPREVLERLATIHNVNLNWLIHGRGPSGLESDTVKIELYDQEAAAGYGREIEDYIEKRFIPVLYDFLRPHRPENLKAVYVSGDSMVNERINDGDIAIFNTKQIEGNSIYVVSIGNTLVVKRVDFSSNAIELISANPAYGPRRYSGPELADIRIAGRVVACWHRL